MISKELLKSSCEGLGITITDEAVDRFDKYAEMLVDYNEKVNLLKIKGLFIIGFSLYHDGKKGNA